MSETATLAAPVDGRQIYSLLPKVMADIGAIAKAKNNTQQGYKFRGIDDALNAIQPALIASNVTVSVNVLEHRLEDTPTGEADRNGKVNPKQRMIRCVLKLQVRFTAPDGSSVDNVTVGESLDYNGDKATNKAMSVAAKYAFFLGLCIPVEEKVLDDSDHDPKSPEETSQEQKQRAASGSSKQPSKNTRQANGAQNSGGEGKAANGTANGTANSNSAGNPADDREKFWLSRLNTATAPKQLRAMKTGIEQDAGLTDEKKAQLKEIAERRAVEREKALETAGAPPG